ncbi:MAG: isoaspartyl peptidase/L-asparaginase, partial [Candidatus Thorarchaeota archaeon]
MNRDIRRIARDLDGSDWQLELPLVVVHGGAGDWKDEKIPIGVEHVEVAAKIGFQVLLDGGSVLDAAEQCTLYMESCGMLNAGRGATRNALDQQELDAMIIDGENLRFGSVASIRGIENPISLARYIMEKTEYVFFAGDGALAQYKNMIQEGYRQEVTQGVIEKPLLPDTMDTVGCIIVDSKGRTAATSSTGGLKNKPLGRVGDSPVFGSGAFANDVGVASATGFGEHIMRVTLCRDVVSHIEHGMDVQLAADKGISFFSEKTKSEAGIIAADVKGNWGKSTNAKAMPVAIIRQQIG